MECFWGIEVEPGQSLTCEFPNYGVINLTQVALGETALFGERVSVYLHVDQKMIVLGTLINGRCNQIGLNLVFNKSFQISHSSKNASLFFCGYSRIVPKWKQALRRDDDSDDDISDDDDDDSISDDDDEEDKNFEDFHNSDDGNENDEDEDDDKDEGTPKDLGNETPRIVKKRNIATNEYDSDDEEAERDEDEVMDDSRSDDKDEESDNEVDDGEDEDEEAPTVAVMCGSNHKRPRENSDMNIPKANKKAKVVTPQGEKAGKGKKYVQFSTDLDGANKSARKGKKNPGGSKQPLASKKTPKSRGTPWPGKKDRSVAKQAKEY